MQRQSFILTGTAVMGTTLLLLFGAFLSTASAASPINFMNPAFGNIALCSSVRLVQQDDFGNFDRESCEQSCRSRYGVGPLPLRGGARLGGEQAVEITVATICMLPASTHVIDSTGKISTGRLTT